MFESSVTSLNKCSRIGFGGYRISNSNKEHRQAFRLAVELGCNLIDTSSNYTDGDSEKLIGDFIKENPKKALFVITKGGYIQGNLLVPALELRKNKALDNYTEIHDTFHHSISPSFLESQIKQSLHRLNRSWLDGYLLHNPEYFFHTKPENPDLIYKHIMQSFEFLENQVNQGTIRYYGISSNTIALFGSNERSLSVRKLIQLANSVSLDNHFKLIQTPYNVFEDHAKRKNDLGESLINIAHQSGIKILANRPLNSSNDKEAIRLATYDQELKELNYDHDIQLFFDLINLVNKQFQVNDLTLTLGEYPILDHLSKNWMKIGNPEAVVKLFHEYLYPFLEAVFEGKIPMVVLKKFNDLKQTSILYSKKLITERARKIQKKLVADNYIKADDNKSLANRLITSYLQDGIDHVLVGCRKEKYVLDIMQFIKPSL